LFLYKTGNSPLLVKGWQAKPDGVFKMPSLYYNPKLKETARKLRKAGILHEALLWRELKSKKLNGLTWTWQKVIGSYIADFYNASNKVVIETDGYSHDNKKQQDNDTARDKYLNSLGITVIRILSKDILQNMEWVLKFLKEHKSLKRNTSITANTPSAKPPPLLRKGE
jgi:very-short-patch-repair endonuclease